jgi:hypothetical protein
LFSATGPRTFSRWVSLSRIVSMPNGIRCQTVISQREQANDLIPLVMGTKFSLQSWSQHGSLVPLLDSAFLPSHSCLPKV